MHKAKKVCHDYRDCCERWSYRGGHIERMLSCAGTRENWRWMVCGANGWTRSKADAKAKIDNILELARKILDAERVPS